MDHSSAYKGILYAIITAILWGVLAVALKVSLSDLSPTDITWFRFVLAFTGLSTYYIFKDPEGLKILKRPPILLITASLCLALNYIGFIKGVQLTSPGTAQIFIQLGPVILALSGFFLFKETIRMRQLIGFTLVFTGLFIFYKEHLHIIITDPIAWKTGVQWVITGALAWAVYSILLKILIQKNSPMQLNLVIFGLPALLFAPFVNFSHLCHLNFIEWLMLVFLGLNTLFAYGLLSLALKYIEANKISVILILNPILTFVIMAIIGASGATWIEHEKLTMLSFLGATIVLSGAVLAVFKPAHFRNK